MATTQKKTTSGAKGGSRSAGSRSGGSRTAPKSRAAARAPAKRPVRREVAGIVLLLVALCVLVSYFTGEGWLIDLIPKLLKGLFGIGYYLAVPALAAAA